MRLRNVGFRYGGPEAPAILEAIDLDVPAGNDGRHRRAQRLRARRRSSSAWPACSSRPRARIELDDVDLTTLNYRSVRRHIGFVLQENYLFDDTIARNIAFGDEPDESRVIWASKLANAHDFVERLPLGYDTRIGESGLRLSGGQRSGSRSPAPSITGRRSCSFDEATSSLDTESERAVKENLDELLHERTSFVIAHRLSTVRDADLIVRAREGPPRRTRERLRRVRTG